MTTILINLQFTIFTYIVIGFLLYKFKLINSDGENFLSSLTLGLFLPVNVFTSFVNNMTVDLLKELILVLVMAIFLETLIYLSTKIKVKFMSYDEECVLHYGMLVSNAGLIGTPVIEGLFGGVGVVFCNVFMIPTRILCFSAGESIFNPQKRKNLRTLLLSILTNKIIIAILLALILLATNISLPSPVFQALENVGKCLSPMSLILVGAILAENASFKFDIVGKVAFLSMLRLFCIPLLALLFCILAKLDFQSTAIIVLILGMPIGSTTAVFAKKYNGNSSFASISVMVTTILSLFTLVVLLQIVELFF